MDPVYIAGEHLGRFDSPEHGEVDAFGLLGVFATADEAEAACSDRTHFVGPVPFGVAIPPGPTEWPGVYYPS